MDQDLDEPSLCIEGVALELGIAKSMLNRWHHLGWAACTEYVTVGVPGVGPVEAKRWSKNELARLQAMIESLKSLENERKCAIRTSSRYRRALARSHLQRVSNAILDTDPVPSTLSNLTESHLGYKVGVTNAIRSLLHEQHKWACTQIDENLDFDGLFHTKCVMKINWSRTMASDGARAFYNRSWGGVRGDHPCYEIRVESKLPYDCTVLDLAKRTSSTKEYHFIQHDPEIGSLNDISPAGQLLQTQLHEMAHAASAWARLQNRSLPKAMLKEEAALRKDAESNGESGHGTDWSSIYRMLRRSAGLVRTTS